MVLQETPTLDRVFYALANPSRRAMLRQLAAGRHNISELAQPLAMSFAGVSKHLKVMEEAGLVRRQVQGRSHVFEIDPATLETAEEWFNYYTELWEAQLDNLDAVLKSSANQSKAGSPENQNT
jgi:DNA-binding transcriptional ArsR family regulator